MEKYFTLFVAAVIFFSCESEKIESKRNIYKNYLYEISDQKEYLKINYEKIVSKDKNDVETLFLVDFETRYNGFTINDKVEFRFIGDFLSNINGESPLKYKTDILLKQLGK